MAKKVIEVPDEEEEGEGEGTAPAGGTASVKPPESKKRTPAPQGDKRRTCASCSAILDRGRFCPDCGLEFDPASNAMKDGGINARLSKLEERMAPVSKFLDTLRGEGVSIEDTKPEHIRKVKGFASSFGGGGGGGGIVGSLRDGLKSLGIEIGVPKVPTTPPAAPKDGTK